jgi:hypothetical protein
LIGKQQAGRRRRRRRRRRRSIVHALPVHITTAGFFF